MKPCPHCGSPDSYGCDDISLAPGQTGRSNRCYERQIAALKFKLEDLRSAAGADTEGAPMTVELHRAFDRTFGVGGW